MTAKIIKNFVLGAPFTTLYYVELVSDIGFVSISSPGASSLIRLDPQIDNSFAVCEISFAYSQFFHAVCRIIWLLILSQSRL
jgi:hypothetical protein